MDEHPRSGSERAAACVDDHAGDVAPRYVRQRNPHAIDAAALPQVEMIQRAGVHAHDRASGTGLGIGNVFVLKNVRTTVAMESDRFHATAISDASPSSR
jgi:hypothetical protein